MVAYFKANPKAACCEQMKDKLAQALTSDKHKSVICMKRSFRIKTNNILPEMILGQTIDNAFYEMLI